MRKVKVTSKGTARVLGTIEVTPVPVDARTIGQAPPPGSYRIQPQAEKLDLVAIHVSLSREAKHYATWAQTFESKELGEAAALVALAAQALEAAIKAERKKHPAR